MATTDEMPMDTETGQVPMTAARGGSRPARPVPSQWYSATVLMVVLLGAYELYSTTWFISFTHTVWTNPTILAITAKHVLLLVGWAACLFALKERRLWVRPLGVALVALSIVSRVVLAVRHSNLNESVLVFIVAMVFVGYQFIRPDLKKELQSTSA